MGGHSSGGLFKGTSGAARSGDRRHSKVDLSKRDLLLGEAKTSEARSIIDELYRQNSTVGDGGTADAIRREKQSNEKVGEKSHILKGKDRMRQIEKILEKNPDHPDKELLRALRDDLRDALGGN